MILGIDPSLTSTGYVVLNNGNIKEQKIITSKPPKIKNHLTELERIYKIRDELPTENIELVVMEGLAFLARNTSALIQLAGLNYIIRDYYYIINIPFIIVAPTSLKKFIALKGNSPKELMLLEIYKRYGISFDNDNLGDAFGLAKIGEAYLGLNKEKLIKPQEEVINLLKNG